jgi:hypothetical protein
MEMHVYYTMILAYPSFYPFQNNYPPLGKENLEYILVMTPN